MAKDFFIWQNNYSVGNIIIDDQHKQLIEILNNLHNAFIKKEHENKIGLVILNLVDYTEIHFKTEERLFKQSNYEHSQEHINEHKLFIKQVNKFKSNFNKDKTILTKDILIFLKEWLEQHILVSDKKYIDNFKKHKISR